jgi:N-acetylglucosaminyl-diphospho-decaprenol L-rhamnosyltransferase
MPGIAGASEAENTLSAGHDAPVGGAGNKESSGLTVVIVTWNGREQLSSCLAALASQTQTCRVVVVDNGSTDGTLDLPQLSELDADIVALPSNVGFAPAANVGAARATTPWVVLLNNDARPRPGWLAALRAATAGAEGRVGFVSTKLLLSGTSRIDSAGDLTDRAFITRPRGHGEEDVGQYDEPGALLGACGGAAAYRVEMWRALGGFCGDFFAYFEDADLCLRAALEGWEGAFAPSAVADHDLSATADRIRGFKRYQGTRNAWWLFVRCVPGPVVPLALPGFLFSQAVWFGAAVKAREVSATLRAWRDTALALPRLLAQRREVQRRRTVSSMALWRSLAPVVETRRLLRWLR